MPTVLLAGCRVLHGPRCSFADRSPTAAVRQNACGAGCNPSAVPPTCDAGGALQLHKHAVLGHLLHGSTHDLGKKGTSTAGWLARQCQNFNRKGDMAANTCPKSG